MGDTIRVGTSMDCDAEEAFSNSAYMTNTKALRAHNALGCHFIELFKLMFKLNVTYIVFGPDALEDGSMLSLLNNGSMDMYARPVGLCAEIVDRAYPIHALFTWRIGFILRRESRQRMLRKFYSKPFSGRVWLSLNGMMLLALLLFFVLSRWERRLGNVGECSLVFELLLAIGGFCQHVFPVETTSLPRRTAYFTFFLFSYVVYTFYTSNLLSHLVSDKEYAMTLAELEQSDYNFMFLEGIKEYQTKIAQLNASRMLQQIRHIPVVGISPAVDAVRRNKTAVLTDYSLVRQEIIKTFSNKEICDLIEIDLFSNIQKYLITSKNFRYKEQMKISALRMQEAGILQRLTSTNVLPPLDCSLAAEVTTSIQQISGLLVVLTCCYVATLFILLCERLHHKRYRLYPYVN